MKEKKEQKLETEAREQKNAPKLYKPPRLETLTGQEVETYQIEQDLSACLTGGGH